MLMRLRRGETVPALLSAQTPSLAFAPVIIYAVLAVLSAIPAHAPSRKPAAPLRVRRSSRVGLIVHPTTTTALVVMV